MKSRTLSMRYNQATSPKQTTQRRKLIAYLALGAVCLTLRQMEGAQQSLHRASMLERNCTEPDSVHMERISLWKVQTMSVIIDHAPSRLLRKTQLMPCMARGVVKLHLPLNHHHSPDIIIYWEKSRVATIHISLSRFQQQYALGECPKNFTLATSYASSIVAP